MVEEKLLENLTKTSIRMPPFVDAYIEKLANAEGVQKSDIIYKGLSYLLPDKLSDLIGSENYNELIAMIKNALLNLNLKNEGDFDLIFRLKFISCDTFDIAINIFNLIFPEKKKKKKNAFVKLLTFKDSFLEEIKHDLISDQDIAERYRKSVDMIFKI